MEEGGAEAWEEVFVFMREGEEDTARGRVGGGRGRTLLFIKSHGSQLFVYHRGGRIWNTNETH